MVEYTVQLDSIFHSLADPVRRDILRRVAQADMSISELAERYTISFAAVSKHLKVMEKAKLISKKKEGKKQIVTLSPTALKSADEYLEQYRLLWQSRHDKLDQLLKGD
jgi:DNA-binding transcriptional ArsR family regulator